MVDVGSKPVTERFARASGRVKMKAETLSRIRKHDFAKGNVLEVARLAGIMAVKKTSDLIPLCHPLPVSGVQIEYEFVEDTVLKISARVRVTARTGAEMEALTAVAASALTIYDMCKSVDRGMQIDSVRLDEKWGGKSGHFERSGDTPEEQQVTPVEKTNSNQGDNQQP